MDKLLTKLNFRHCDSLVCSQSLVQTSSQTIIMWCNICETILSAWRGPLKIEYLMFQSLSDQELAGAGSVESESLKGLMLRWCVSEHSCESSLTFRTDA